MMKISWSKRARRALKHMKRAPSPQIIGHGQIKKQNSTSQNGVVNNKMGKKNHKAAFKSIKAAAKKLAGVFTIILRKPTSGKAEADGRSNQGRVREIASSEDNSSRSSSKNKLNRSPGSSKSLGSEKIGKVDFSFEEIYNGTGKFAEASKIGEGGFGIVYKAKLKDGSFVAVKRVKKDLHGKRLSTEFKNEILTLSKIEHLNLVKFFGFLEHGGEQLVLVEYVGNGTLREHLDGTCGNGLEIAERLDIAIDVAHAVTYLHTYTDRAIIHRDIKASNILITEKLRAKVADFGVARIAAEDVGATHISTEVKGTAGYLDPEYMMTNQLTEKSDVYSFGVLLVELITGRHPLEPKKSLSERVTIKWALKKLKEGEAIIVMDPRLRRSPASMMVVEKVLKLARICLAPSRQSRPHMRKCAEVLWRIRKDYNEKCHSAAALSYNNSANIAELDAMKNRHNYFGIEDSESYRFRSA